MTFNLMYLKKPNQALTSLFTITNILIKEKIKNQSKILSNKQLEILCSHWLECTQYKKKITKNNRKKIKQQFNLQLQYANYQQALNDLFRL